jgi:hypothetical protein
MKISPQQKRGAKPVIEILSGDEIAPEGILAMAEMRDHCRRLSTI